MAEKTSSMSKIAKHLNIIAKIKSFVKKEKISSSNNSEDVSKDVANVIQVSSYNLSQNYKKDNKFTPIYKVISEQLASDNNPIFFSAIYNLVKIAHNQTKDRETIVNILKDQYEKTKSDKERQDYLALKLKELRVKI